jgi:hypothetical protein
MTKRSLALLLLSGALSAVAALGGASPAFARSAVPILPEGSLGKSGGQTAQASAIAEDGDAVTIWEAETSPENFNIVAKTRPAGGEWGPLEVLSPAGVGTELMPGTTVPPAFYTSVAIGPNDEVVAAWSRQGANNHMQVETASLPSFGDDWDAAEELTDDSSRFVVPQAAIGPDGTAIVAWEKNSEHIVEASTRLPGGIWGEAKDLSDAATEEARQPMVKFDAAGDALAVWADHAAGKDGIVSDYLPAGGSWQGPVDATVPTTSVDAPSFAFDEAGDATLLYQSFDGTTYRVEALELTHGAGTWSSPTVLSSAGAGAPQVAVDAAGDAIAAWTQNVSGIDNVYATTRQAGGSWEAAVPLTSAALNEPAERPLVSINPDGRGLAVWQQTFGGTTQIEFDTVFTGNFWSDADPLSDNGGAVPTLSQNASGQVVGTWRANGEVETFIYDPTDPKIESLNIPAMAKVGEAVEFSVEPKVLGGLVFTEWEFAPGVGSSGEAVHHVFTTPGTYTVTVYVENEIGEATANSEASGQIVVTEAETPPSSGGETTTGGGSTTTGGSSTATTTTTTSTSTTTTAKPSAPKTTPDWLRLAKVERTKSAGNGGLVLKAPGKGTITVSGPGVKTTTVKTKGKGAKVTLVLTPKGSFAKRLAGGHHRGWTTVTIVYTPSNGDAPVKATRRVRLVKR